MLTNQAGDAIAVGFLAGKAGYAVSHFFGTMSGTLAQPLPAYGKDLMCMWKVHLFRFHAAGNYVARFHTAMGCFRSFLLRGKKTPEEGVEPWREEQAGCL